MCFQAELRGVNLRFASSATGDIVIFAVLLFFPWFFFFSQPLLSFSPSQFVPRIGCAVETVSISSECVVVVVVVVVGDACSFILNSHFLPIFVAVFLDG